MMIDRPEADESGLGLRHYLDVLRRRKWIVLAVVAAAIAVAALISALQKPVYQAQEKIVIGQGNTLIAPGAAGAFQQYSATMANLLESNVVARNVIDSLRLPLSEEALLSKVSVSINPQTAVLQVSVQDHSRAQARRIASQIGVVFTDLVKSKFGHEPVPTGVPGEPPQPLTANVWDPAHINSARVKPKPVRNVFIAGVLGLVLGLLAAFLREHFDRRLRTREDVELAFGAPVIGQIPFTRRRRGAHAFSGWDHGGHTGEAFRALRANLQYLAVRRPLRTILITSAAAGQGKTTVTANLAIAIARSGATTVAIEGDLRRPQLVEALGVSKDRPGLTNMLVGAEDLDNALLYIPLATGDNGAGSAGEVAFLASGPRPPNPSELLSSLQMTELLERLTSVFDHVLIDSPPLLLVADALELARMVDGVVLVVRANSASADEAREVRALVERLGIHLVGVVLTDVERPASYYGYGESPAREKALQEASEPVAEEF
jgi:capsular exopolysaccharide synthesis family protein